MAELGRAALIAISCASALIAAACASMAPSGSGGGGGPSALMGTRWAAQTIDGQRVTGARVPTLNFDSQRHLNGNGGCNSYFGSYSARGEGIEVSGVGRTEMACAEPIMAQENNYLQRLDQASRFMIQGGRLVISGPSGHSVTFVRTG